MPSQTASRGRRQGNGGTRSMRGRRQGGKGKGAGRKPRNNGQGRNNQRAPELNSMPGLDNLDQKKSAPKEDVAKAAPVEEVKPKTLEEMTAAELKAECEKAKLLSEGSEAELRTRIETSNALVFATDLAASDDERAAARETLITNLTAGEGLFLMKAATAINFTEFALKVIKKSGKAAGKARESMVNVLVALVEKAEQTALPLVLPMLNAVLGLYGDKVKGPKNAAAAFVAAVLKISGNFAPRVLLPGLMQKTSNWQANEARMKLVVSLCETAPDAMGACLSTAIPVVAEVLHDLKPKVKKAARAALKKLVAIGANDDVVPLMDTLLSALERNNEIKQCVHKLASTTFVQTVDGPSLAVMSPILLRGFAVNDVATKRACARIIENMSKLVEEPLALAANFLPAILPKLELARDHVASPEAREVCRKACEMLVLKSTVPPGTEGVQDMLAELNAEFKVEEKESHAYIEFSAELLSTLNDLKNYEIAEWEATAMPYLSAVTDEATAKAALAKIAAKANVSEEEEEEEEDADELCNCEFSLAYGNKVLLRKTKLRLVRGRSYGLIGQNDSGKTSLMRAIADHRVDGFPPEHELRTVFVETDIQGELSDLSVLDYIMADEIIKSLDITRESMTETLVNVGFTDDSPANITTMVGSLSGGWKMKLALARAMQLNADILLLDEPTNHLDSYNVKWVEDYLTGLEGVTCVMVSHDSGFLNRVCSDIIQIKNFRLAFHKGNLESFVAKNPEASSFFELKTAKFSFKFPNPPRLKGINSKGKAIMKMKNISFTYPGAEKAQLNNVTIQVSLGSRVACVGVNGAGKSTMIKLLTGELEPDEGSGDVWTHPNMMYGYIAQHAFHHIENHLDKTANEYIRWRYRYGNDREALNKITNVVTDEEQKIMNKPVSYSVTNPETGLKSKRSGKIKRLTEGRRDNKKLKEQEYEVIFQGFADNQTNWIPRSALEKGGWIKVLKQVDDRIVMREAMFSRPLTKTNVASHLADVGLEEEFSSHMRIGALSGGQKVKVVLGAALWNRPHVLILDEPTNYLDRDSLGALAGAIREFEGGVVMITHNSQFCNNLCPQVWHLENNTLNVKGDASWMHMEMLKDEEKSSKPGFTVDKFGNTVKIKRTIADLTPKELRRYKKGKAKRRRERIKRGDHPDDTDSDLPSDF